MGAGKEEFPLILVTKYPKSPTLVYKWILQTQPYRKMIILSVLFLKNTLVVDY